MAQQNSVNHTRIHPLFHYVIVPASALLFVMSVYLATTSTGIAGVKDVMASLLLLMVAFIARDYAKKNQDRIIRAELRLRYFQLTGGDFGTIEEQLNKDQLVALRFADDGKFIELTSMADLAALPASEIKKQIKTWKPDLMRV